MTPEQKFYAKAKAEAMRHPVREYAFIGVFVAGLLFMAMMTALSYSDAGQKFLLQHLADMGDTR